MEEGTELEHFRLLPLVRSLSIFEHLQCFLCSRVQKNTLRELVPGLNNMLREG